MRLIDADALKEEITFHFDLELEPVIEKEVLRMIDEQETISAASPKWISVKDRLPSYETTVMVYSELCGIGLGFIDNRDEKWCGHCYDEDVLYWMPLPEPPEVESNE